MKRELICIVCPRGCAMTVEGEKDNLTVVGNACPKGKQYAIDECTHPTRTVTSIVRVANRVDTMTSVKTEAPIPKEHIFDLLEKIRAIRVEAPVEAGTVVLPDVYGTNVVITKNVK
ncbi:MAG: DUF1667 domain-containing protein [Clostridia bacterium]|nr:DUF1667 domain-containing protein [Clostridia bacterium]